MGTVLGIPLNAAVDALFRDANFFGWKFPAIDLIVGGFMLMLLPPGDSQCLQRGVAKAVTCSCRRCKEQRDVSLTE